MKFKICKVKNCNRPHEGLGYCGRHYLQWRRNGRILDIKPPKNNKIRCYNNYCYISLYNNKRDKVAEGIVDKEDIEKIKKYKWYLTRRGYIATTLYNKNKKFEHTLLHRFLINPPKDKVIDHINHNKLDNRKSNLKICTTVENGRNRKYKPKGYYWDKQNKIWRSYISINKKQIFLGSFSNKKNAIKKRKEAELKYWNLKYD